jgi:hypothetical protein
MLDFQRRFPETPNAHNARPATLWRWHGLRWAPVLVPCFSPEDPTDGSKPRRSVKSLGYQWSHKKAGCFSDILFSFQKSHIFSWLLSILFFLIVFLVLSYHSFLLRAKSHNSIRRFYEATKCGLKLATSLWNIGIPILLLQLAIHGKSLPGDPEVLLWGPCQDPKRWQIVAVPADGFSHKSSGC